MNASIQNTLIDNYIKNTGIITPSQISDTEFDRWDMMMKTLYVQALDLYNKDWKNATELAKRSTKHDIWTTIRVIYDEIIGFVNGYALPRNTNLVCLIVSYLVTSYGDKAINNLPLQERFRLKFEYMLARKIIEQKAKTDRELEDALNDKKAVRALDQKKKNRNQISFKSESKVQKQPKPQQYQDGDILYIYKARNRCEIKEHNIVATTAVLIGKNNAPLELSVNYCQDCNKFFINYISYEQYRKKYGVLIGNIVLKDEGVSSFGDVILSEASPLKLCGYSVNQQDDLSRETRQYIIRQIISRGIMSKPDVVRYLEYFINMNGRRTGNEIAVSKWKEDLRYTLSFNFENQTKHKIKKITRY